MALKEIILFSCFIVIVNCQGDPFDDMFNGFPGFPKLYFPQLPNFNFPQIPMPVVPSPKDLKDIKPRPGEVFHGISASSANNLVRDKDGKLFDKGGTIVVTNNNGKVDEYKSGNAPPDLNQPLQSQIPEKWSNFHHKKQKFHKPDFKPIKKPAFKPIKKPAFKPIKKPVYKPIKKPAFKHTKRPAFKPIKMPEMKKHQFEFPDLNDNNSDNDKHGAKGNSIKSETAQSSHSSSSSSSYSSSDGDSKPEHFSYSTNSFSNSLDLNGVKSSDGGSQTIIDDNGKIEKEKVAFKKHDKPKKEKKD